MTALHQPPPDAVQWDCPDCGDGYWLTAHEAQAGCPATHPSDCGAKLTLRPGVVRCCRLDVDECARRCSGKPGSCDTYGDGLVADGLGCRVAGRRVVVDEDGQVSVELDLVPQEPAADAAWDETFVCDEYLAEAERKRKVDEIAAEHARRQLPLFGAPALTPDNPT